MQGVLKRSRPQDVQYKGDWMRRPVGSNEVGWLVRLLLALSDRLNHALYLDSREVPPAGTEPSAAQVRFADSISWLVCAPAAGAVRQAQPRAVPGQQGGAGSWHRAIRSTGALCGQHLSAGSCACCWRCQTGLITQCTRTKGRCLRLAQSHPQYRCAIEQRL